MWIWQRESPRDSVSLSLDMFNILYQFEGGRFFLKKRVGTFYNMIHYGLGDIPCIVFHITVFYVFTRLPTSYLRTYTVITWLLKSRSSRRGYEEICFYFDIYEFLDLKYYIFLIICELLVYVYYVCTYLYSEPNKQFS